jgi:hypothetical protein
MRPSKDQHFRAKNQKSALLRLALTDAKDDADCAAGAFVTLYTDSMRL